ncbi:MAG: hypothetical protein ACK4PR_12440, partial [Gammaproteobacteria bacterium]
MPNELTPVESNLQQLVNQLSALEKAGEAGKAERAEFFDSIARGYRKLANPTKSQVNEMVLLAIFAPDEQSYLSIINGYLDNLGIERYRLHNAYHVMGLARIMQAGIRKNKSFNMAEHSKTCLDALFALLERESALAQHNEKYRSNVTAFADMIAVYENYNHATKSKLDADSLARMKRNAAAYQQAYDKRYDLKDNKTALAIIDQAITRINAPDVWDTTTTSVLFLVSAGINLTTAIGKGTAGGLSTYGIGALGGLPDAVAGIKDLLNAGLVIAKHIKTHNYDIKTWYENFECIKGNLNQAYVISGDSEPVNWSEVDETSTIGLKISPFHAALKTLLENSKHPFSKQQPEFILGITQHISSLLYSNIYSSKNVEKEISEQQEHLQRGCLESLVKIFRTHDNHSVRASILREL